MSDLEKTSDSSVHLAMLVLLAGVIGLLQVSGARSRESLLPAMRVVERQEKGIDRAVGAALPLPPDEERAAGERLEAHVPRDLAPEHRPLQGLVEELGRDAERAPLVLRFRGRYVFEAVESPSLNAFAGPGGFIHVTTALAERLRGRDDQLLFVLGHEIGHVELGHCADSIRLQAYGRAVGVGVAGDAAALLRQVAAMSFSKDQELEADEYAARLVASLHRDPAAGLQVFDALGLRDPDGSGRGGLEAPGGPVLEAVADYFQTHPGAWERREHLRGVVARLPR